MNKQAHDQTRRPANWKEGILLWLAQGFGVGRIPVAPGTFGSVLGLFWFALLLAPGRLWMFIAGLLLGLALSVCLCGQGERILGQTDPGSVVWDEVAAMPVCFVAWVGVELAKTGAFPSVGYFFSKTNWPLTAGIFVLFRFFDVVKPPPVRQSQKLPGGWGITVDDLLAAVFVNLVALLFYGGLVITRGAG